MNSFPDDPDVSGPLALFMPGSEKGQMLAELIQRQLNKALDSDGEARSENLSVLRNGSQPSVLVECGFLSNEEEEKNLQQETYQQTVVNAICDGIAAFFAQ
jgi:N-acetylmuramoyl-L-alanine amidase